MLKTERKVPVEACRFKAPQASSVVKSDAASGRFTLTPYAGQQFNHWFWGKLAFDVGGLSMRKAVIPAFLDHDSAELVGEIDSIAKDGKRVDLSGAFADTDAASTVKSTKKLEWECSLAFNLASARIEEVGKEASAVVNGETFLGPGFIVREAELYETSFTYFGAVPNTEASFSAGQVNVTIFQQEGENMSDATKNTEQAGGTRDLFNKMNAICDDKTFVAEEFSKGATLEQFQNDLLRKVQTENAALRKQVGEFEAKAQAQAQAHAQAQAQALAKSRTESGAAPLAFSEAATPQPAADFMAEARKLSQERSLSMRDAMSTVARTRPELYKQFKAACPAVISQS